MSSDLQAFKIYSIVTYYRLNIDMSKELQINTVFPNKKVSNNSNPSTQCLYHNNNFKGTLKRRTLRQD